MSTVLGTTATAVAFYLAPVEEPLELVGTGFLITSWLALLPAPDGSRVRDAVDPEAAPGSVRVVVSIHGRDGVETANGSLFFADESDEGLLAFVLLDRYVTSPPDEIPDDPAWSEAEQARALYDFLASRDLPPAPAGPPPAPPAAAPVRAPAAEVEPAAAAPHVAAVTPPNHWPQGLHFPPVPGPQVFRICTWCPCLLFCPQQNDCVGPGPHPGPGPVQS